jgi:hypothetical protein
MQDQLLAESEAAVPAEMVREFQVAGLRGASPVIPGRAESANPESRNKH